MSEFMKELTEAELEVVTGGTAKKPAKKHTHHHTHHQVHHAAASHTTSHHTHHNHKGTGHTGGKHH